MKLTLKKQRFFFLFLLIPLFFGLCSEITGGKAFADIWTSQGSGRYKLFDGTSIDGIYARGIDVSHWQGEIDWKEVAKDDVKFAMIGTGYPNKPDPRFHYNAREAAKAGINLGIYIYSYAENPEQAEAEADYVLNLIKDYPVSYPVAYDIEDETAHGSLSKEELSAIIFAFTKKIKDAGYHPMLYASDYWFATKFDLNALKDLDVWVARYHKLHQYNKPAIWQATSEGSIRGIKGRVDINFQYKDFTDIIPKNLSRTIAGKVYHYKNYVLQSSEPDSALAQGPGVSPSPGSEEPSQGPAGSLTPSQGGDSSPAKTGWILENGTWYYFDANSRMQTGWIKEQELWYYLDEKGAMRTGWIKDKDGWYFLSPSGAMKTGWIKEQELWYYLDASGRMQTGMLTLGDTKYFLEKDGHMLADTMLRWEGVDYLIDSSGAMRQSAGAALVSLSSPSASP